MSVNVTKFDAGKDYAEVSDWWTAQGWPVIPISHLPSIGFVVEVGGIKAACGWIYQTDSAFCLLEWIVVNPIVRREARTAALEALIETAKAAAVQLGFKTIFTSVRSQPLISRLEKRGFVISDNGMSNMICDIQKGE